MAQPVFLQSLLSQRMLSEQDILALYSSCFNQNDQQAFENFIVAANNSLDLFGLRIQKAISPDTATPVYALINTDGDDIAQFATEYSPIEIKYLKELINQMVTKTKNCLIGSNHALQIIKLISGPKSKPSETLSKRDVEKFLDQLVYDKWLLELDGKYTLSARSLLELDSYLRETFDESIIECNMCKKIVTVNSHTCNQCDAKFHKYCSQRVLTRSPKCPACRADWVEKEQESDEEIEISYTTQPTQSEVEPSQPDMSQLASGSKSRKKSKVREEFSDDDDE